VERITRLHPDRDQLALARAIGESVADVLPLSRLHRADDEDDATWAKLQDIGVFSIGLNEEAGGSNLGATEESLIVIELGHQLAAPSVLATIGATHAPRGPQPFDAAPVAAAYQNGTRRLVVNGRNAKRVLLRLPNGALLQELDGGTVKCVDRHLWCGEISEIPAPEASHIEFQPDQVLRLRLIDAAYLAGVAQAALDMSVSYALSREQFGRPIGSFQAIKHHCANMAIAARCARDLTTFAALAIDEARDDAALQVESALYVAGSAALESSAKNIQIHGGLGFSDEADAHLLLKRTRLQLAIAGGLESANERVADTRLEW
jgi:alkylation response protein AidB-like acyl-CoA dehydrogenase